MDFQELLNIAAENKKKAQKEASQTKRYTTQLPPPKKEKRAGVDQAAIRSRLEKKQREKQQKALEEEAKKQQLLKLRAESNKKGKKSAEKPKINGRAQSDARNRDYEDEKHEQRHLSFMKKVQNAVEKTRREEPKSVSKEAPDRPKKPKKPAAAPKGPMSYEQLLALAANQQKGGNQSESKTSKSVAPTHKEPKASQEPPAKHKGQRVPKQDDMSLKKAAAARKLGEARQREFLKQRSSERAGSAPGGKSQCPATNGVTAQPHRTNGKVAARSDKQGSKPGAKVSQTAVSKPGTSTSKTKHFPTTNSRPQQKTPESKVNGALTRDDPKQHKQERERKRAPAALHQSRVEEYFDKAPSGHRPRPVPQQPPPPMRQSKMDQYYDRAPSGSRPQPGLQRRTSPVDAHVHRKRPASSAPPSFRAKHGRLLSEEDSDYEDDGFIDDTPLEDGGEDVSHYIKEIFGYDKTKYGYESDYALRNMESSYRDIQKEEARSTRLGMQEDIEDMRQEKLEKRRLMAKAAAMKKRR